jgi:2,3-diketo-5-methylthiopentyl-1-phosphate enolase
MCPIFGKEATIMEFDIYLTPITESLNQNEYVIATYLVGAPTESDILHRCTALALEQTTGTWARVPGETDEVRKRSAGRVIAVYSVPDYESKGSIAPDSILRWYIARIAFPCINFYDNLPLLLSSVIGNVSAMDNLKLVDLDFPEAYTAQFKGPKFGVQGLRDLLKVKDRPLLNNMIKPCTGITPEEGAAIFYGAAAGGTDWIKDDELIAFSPLTERVKAYMAAGKRADKEKGELTLYSVNISDNPDRLLDNALRAIDAGANALMVNIFPVGFGGVRLLAEDPRITVPLMIHNCMSGVWVANPFGGISSVVGAKLARLSGADMYLDYVPTMKFGGIPEKFQRIAHTCLAPFHAIKPTMVHLGGGVTPGIVPHLMGMLGNDIAIGAGGGIHTHPLGPKAGAKAMRDAIDAAITHTTLAEAAKSSKELDEALRVWGEFGSEKMKKLFSLS